MNPSDEKKELELDRSSFEVLSKHAKSFRWAAVFLAQDARRDAALLYAFCRLVDDIVDEGSSQDEAEAELLAIEKDLERSVPQNPLLARFREIAERRGFGLGPALDLIRGMRSDLGPVRVQSAEELELYCYRAAGTVGLMMAGTLGAARPEAQRYAASLGMAMQLTNICRDVLEDMARDRLYLPENILQKHACDCEQLMAGSARRDWDNHLTQGLVRTVHELLARAEHLYSFSSQGFKMIPWRSRLAVLVAALLYREIGRTLLKFRAGNPLLGRVVVSPLRKCRLLFEAIGRLVSSRLALTEQRLDVKPYEQGLDVRRIDPYSRRPLS